MRVRGGKSGEEGEEGEGRKKEREKGEGEGEIKKGCNNLKYVCELKQKQQKCQV